MQKQLQIWQFIHKSLQANIPVMLLYVLESNGSSPGRQGFFMAVNKDGEMHGSIGGGIMEHKFVEMAKDRLKHNMDITSVKKQVHDKSAANNQSGMICSGEQTVFIYKIQQSESDAIAQIIQWLQQDKNGLLQLSPGGISFSEAETTNQFQYVFHSENDWQYSEKIGYIHHLHVIGGGHCSLPFCKIMNMLGFYIYLYDDRQGLITFEENIFAHQKIIVDDYSQLQELIAEDATSYVVVMTFGYRTDDIAVRALLNKRFKYFGLLGSKAKIEQMFAGYINEGISKEILNNIHAPVGINISSQTPEEIAVSIAAEIIGMKNKAFQAPNNFGFAK